MDCPHSTPEPWQECRNPNRPILAAEVEWKGGRFAGNQGTGRTGADALARSAGFFLWPLTSGIVGDQTCDGYYQVFLHVCIYSRSSRLLWGSGNARRNRMDEGREVGTGFPNQDGPNVGVLENRGIVPQRLSEDPKPSTDGDGRCAMPLWWMSGNLGANRPWSGDEAVRISTIEW
jgi:hypothetical protein